ncbi:MAG: sigma-54-dependent transcriptional regulator [Candidatus Egerieousia sp.]
MTKAGKILVADDNQGIRSSLKLLLPNYFSDVEIISSPKILISKIEAFRPDAVLLDMNFTDENNTGNEGLFWLSEIKSKFQEINVVLFTAYADVNLAVEGMKRGAFDFIVKPWENAKLIKTLQEAASRRKKATIEKVSDRSIYWGESPEMQEIRKTVEKVAATDASVLITGENGTGKDMIANQLHLLSDRRERPFVAVDLGSLNDNLFESEMFGHVKGSFTGAFSDHAGKFEQAGGGTLFLDEIANLPLNLQSKLLRVLQNRAVTRIGDTVSRPFDIRLICATNGRLEELVQKGEFREDLYYRINTVRINLPPLRERKDEILPLAHRFISEYTEKYHRNVTDLSSEAETKLLQHNWSGNVRELKNCIETAVIMSEGGEIRAEDIKFSKIEHSTAQSGNETLAMTEERAIREALDKFGGNLSVIAKVLKISRPTLYAKLKKYNI